MATALMAGIAGLVVEFSRLRCELSESVMDPDALLTREGMEAVLQLMVPKNELKRDPDGYLYLRPWILFRSPKSTDPWKPFYEINMALSRSKLSHAGG